MTFSLRGTGSMLHIILFAWPSTDLRTHLMWFVHIYTRSFSQCALGSIATKNWPVSYWGFSLVHLARIPLRILAVARHRSHSVELLATPSLSPRTSTHTHTHRTLQPLLCSSSAPHVFTLMGSVRCDYRVDVCDAKHYVHSASM